MEQIPIVYVNHTFVRISVNFLILIVNSSEPTASKSKVKWTNHFCLLKIFSSLNYTFLVYFPLLTFHIKWIKENNKMCLKLNIFLSAGDVNLGQQAT